MKEPIDTLFIGESMHWRKKAHNVYGDVSPVSFTTNEQGNVTGWSQTMRHVVPEQSPHWSERKDGNFTREGVYPCSEGFPGVVRIGPIEGGWPMIFDLWLADRRRVSGTVSTEIIDDQPAWAVTDAQGATSLVSYYEVAAWATPSGDYDWFERMILWLVTHWPGRR